MEVFKMLPEGTLAELINGSLYMSPAPSTNHQRTIGKIHSALSAYLVESDKGELLISPCDVYLDETSNAVQPDVIFISSEKTSIIREDAIHGVPDLLIEVLSAGNSHHDLIKKKSLYEKFGVSEYWVVDPQTKESIVFSLRNDVYVEYGRFIAKIISPLLQTTIEF